MKTISTLGEYATAEQLAECLNMSRSALYQLQKAGKFPRGVRIGHARRWNVATVQAWLAAQEEGTTA